MRTDFHRQLDLFNADLAAMCGLADTAIHRANDALCTPTSVPPNRSSAESSSCWLNLNADRRALSLLTRR